MELIKDEILFFKNIKFVREKREILRDINWQIKKGENWALLGLNGAGKSTLLGMIPAYTFPTKGEIRVFGHTFGNYAWPKIRKRLGFVSSSLNNFLNTLNEEIVLDVVISGKFSSIGIYEKILEEDREKAEKIIEEFGITKLKNNKFKNLSQGEQRRTLLARAFMNDPDLLILDEPCSGLDIRAREYLLKSLEERANKEMPPFLYVTHQIEEIIPAITHVALLGDNGEMLATGLKEEILTSSLLSKLYGIKVKVLWENNRPWLII